MQIDFPGLYDDDITSEGDGTFTVSLLPWFHEPIVGVPTKDLAVQIAHAAHQAMQSYANDAMIED